jgi:hypothetical protein
MKSSNIAKDLPKGQQQIERHYFELFRRAYPLPSGTITYGDKPDVILYGPQSIGIEITRLYVAEGSCSASEQVQRVRRRTVVSKAQRCYEQLTGNNIQLTFSFDKRHPIQDSNALVTKLVELARRVEGCKNGKVSKAVFEDIPELEFAHLNARELVYAPYVDPDFPDGQPDSSKRGAAFAEYRNRREARARREGIYQPLSTANWIVLQGHAFGSTSTARLTEIIKAKEAKAQHYASCDVYWLLIVVEFIDSAQEQDIRLEGSVGVVSDVFHRIIVYKPYFEHILEIEPHRTALLVTRKGR